MSRLSRTAIFCGTALALLVVGAGCAPTTAPHEAADATGGFVALGKDFSPKFPVMPGMRFEHGRERMSGGDPEYFVDYTTYETPKTVAGYYALALEQPSLKGSSDVGGRTGWELTRADDDRGTTFTLTHRTAGLRDGSAQLFVDAARYGGRTRVTLMEVAGEGRPGK